MNKNLRPNKAEGQFLQLAYNRFYDIYDEITDDSFWLKEESYRFSKIRECFLIYSEALNYEPIQWVLKYVKKSRPPMEAELGKEFFSFVRNLFVHFPFFSKWSEIYFNRSLINWNSEGKSIDKFLIKYEGHEPVKYRLWSYAKKSFTYITISFPKDYKSDERINLSNILPEKEGIIFSIAFMRKILNTQVEK